MCKKYCYTIYKTYQIRIKVCIHCTSFMKHVHKEFICKITFVIFLINTIPNRICQFTKKFFFRAIHTENSTFVVTIYNCYQIRTKFAFMDLILCKLFVKLLLIFVSIIETISELNLSVYKGGVLQTFFKENSIFIV